MKDRVPARRAKALLLLALLIALAVPPLAAAPRRGLQSPATGGWWASPAFWQGLAASIPYIGRPLAGWLTSGCGVDSNGRPLCGAKTTGESGCGMDPNGRPLCGAATVNVDSGCGADPDGRPLCGSH